MFTKKGLCGPNLSCFRPNLRPDYCCLVLNLTYRHGFDSFYSPGHFKENVGSLIRNKHRLPLGAIIFSDNYKCRTFGPFPIVFEQAVCGTVAFCTPYTCRLDTVVDQNRSDIRTGGVQPRRLPVDVRPFPGLPRWGQS